MAGRIEGRNEDRSDDLPQTVTPDMIARLEAAVAQTIRIDAEGLAFRVLSSKGNKRTAKLPGLEELEKDLK